MKISEAMSRDVRIASPDQTICEAASIMSEIDAGALPVGENDRLIGMITDRDITVRAVAQNRPPSAKVRLVGIVSLGDLALAEDAATTGQAVAGISKPGGSHCHAAV